MIFGEGEGNYPIFQIASHHQGKIVLVLLAVFFLLLYIYTLEIYQPTNQPTDRPTHLVSIIYLN